MAQILEACAHEAARALGARYGLEDPALGLRAPTDREPRWEHQRHNVRAMTELARE